MPKKTKALIGFMIGFFWITTSYAQPLENLAIHGFGGWAYGKTDNENQYLAGNPDGSYDYLNFSLNITAKPHERLALHIQSGFNEDKDRDEAGLDYAFAEWSFSDAFRIRSGKIRTPIMLYTEIYDVGPLRPFFFLPQGVYQSIAVESYEGIGITGSFLFKGGWEIMYDLCGGQITLLPKRYLNLKRFEFDFVTPIAHDAIGGRLTVHTPLDGFNLRFSSYTGDLELEAGEINLSDRYTGIGLSAEYLSNPWWIRSEYMTLRDSSEIGLDVVYCEVAYRFTEHWQAAARYEVVDLELPAVEAVYPKSFIEHQELALGLNYWLNPNLVFKFSYHFVEGNRYANPETPEDFVASFQQGRFDERTHLIIIGTQFSF
jgi:hypothetical protein